jgi:DNA topoisomerase-1
MAKRLLIVESPTKAKTISRYVGNEYEVMASVGHVKDLPKSRMGVDTDNSFSMELEIIRGKKKVLNELKKVAKKVDQVFLAPDPDREGEAIAWHIAEEIEAVNKKILRVTFNQITKQAVNEAIKQPRELNRSLYDAQQARRILDRLVGYEISPLLWDKVRRGLSAGRVQSVAVRLIVEREAEIEAFVPKEYWTIDELLHPTRLTDSTFKASLAKIDGKKMKVDNEKDANQIKKELLESEHKIGKVEKKKRTRRAPAPFITSTLQQSAASVLRFSAKRTMVIAQQLYEGVEIEGEGSVGLITYMRTDSTRVAPEAISEVRSHIEENFGKKYLPKKPNTFKSKKGAQDAHEAIRPSVVEYSPEKIKNSLTREQYKLYDLIWRQFVASQMTAAVYDQTSVTVLAGERFELRATGSILAFAGWLAAAKPNRDEDEEITFPVLNDGESLEIEEISPIQHFTQPPPRFSEGTLVKELEDQGIGRPSTYAAILGNIQSKRYVEKIQSRLHPTELGKLVTELLVESFPDILDVEFTAGMEEKLDDVESGKVDWVKLLKDFYGPFTETMQKAQENMRDVKREEIPTEHKCEECNETMMIRWGRNGFFLACAGYPKCNNTREIKSRKGNVVEIAPIEDTGEECEKCGKPMIIRRGRYGRFLACSGYPDCKNTRSVSTGIKCPQCAEGDIVERRSKRGMMFYACNRYPDCKYSIWNEPIEKECPICKFKILVRKETKKDGLVLSCPVKECTYKVPVDELPDDNGDNGNNGDNGK